MSIKPEAALLLGIKRVITPDIRWGNELQATFEAAAEYNRWTNQEKATALILVQIDKALEILPTLPADKLKEYDIVKSALEIQYGSQYLKQACQRQLKARVQGSSHYKSMEQMLENQ